MFPDWPKNFHWTPGAPDGHQKMTPAHICFTALYQANEACNVALCCAMW